MTYSEYATLALSAVVGAGRLPGVCFDTLIFIADVVEVVALQMGWSFDIVWHVARVRPSSSLMAHNCHHGKSIES